MHILDKIIKSRLLDLFYLYLHLLGVPEQKYKRHKYILAFILGISLAPFENRHMVSKQLADMIFQCQDFPLFLLSLQIIIVFISKVFFLYFCLSILIEKTNNKENNDLNSYVSFFFCLGYLWGMLLLIGTVCNECITVYSVS